MSKDRNLNQIIRKDPIWPLWAPAASTASPHR